MNIAIIILTRNNLLFLKETIREVDNLKFQPKVVVICSRSISEAFQQEQLICQKENINILVNQRTDNVSGAINTAIEEIVNLSDNLDNTYISIFDESTKLPTNLYDKSKHSQSGVYDIISYYSLDEDIKGLQDLVSYKNIINNSLPIWISRSFFRLKTVLMAGCFDEHLEKLYYEDFIIRFSQLNISYSSLSDTQFSNILTANTIDFNLNEKNWLLLKYKHPEIKLFQEKADKSILSKKHINGNKNSSDFAKIYNKNVSFNGEKKFQFIVGFIAGCNLLSERMCNQIVKKIKKIDLVLIIDNTNNGLTFTEEILKKGNVKHIIITKDQWSDNLNKSFYGEIFKTQRFINSIPLGRSILHKHLFLETESLPNPVFWIIDDDISFSFLSANDKLNRFDLFEFINQYKDKANAIVGSISKDPPIPALCCIRTQLVDMLFSLKNKKYMPDNDIYDPLNLNQEQDYYYDLSDVIPKHLEVPILKKNVNNTTIKNIYSGKSVTRPALFNDLITLSKPINKSGGNTLIFDREMLNLFPVININIDGRYARRGDLLWIILNQSLAEKNILESSFSVNHSRLQTEFNLEKEMEKAIHDIVGYAFVKSFMQIKKIIINKESNHKEDIIQTLLSNNYFNKLSSEYMFLIDKRKAKFLMNLYRILGLINILEKDFSIKSHLGKSFKITNEINLFHDRINNAKNKIVLRRFLMDLKKIIQSKPTENNC